jgi:hypothetical protein
MFGRRVEIDRRKPDRGNNRETQNLPDDGDPSAFFFVLNLTCRRNRMNNIDQRTPPSHLSSAVKQQDKDRD